MPKIGSCWVQVHQECTISHGRMKVHPFTSIEVPDLRGVYREVPPIGAPQLPVRVEYGLELRVAPQGLELGVGVQPSSPRIST